MRLFQFTLCLLSSSILFFACKKGSGEGGRATIKGSVYAINHSNTFISVDSGFLGDAKVFIKYGDEAGVSDNVDTDYKGEFSFPYLRKGDYTVFVYSKVLINNTLDTFISQKVTIKDRTESITLPKFRIFTLKN